MSLQELIIARIKAGPEPTFSNALFALRYLREVAIHSREYWTMADCLDLIQDVLLEKATATDFQEHRDAKDSPFPTRLT